MTQPRPVPSPAVADRRTLDPRVAPKDIDALLAYLDPPERKVCRTFIDRYYRAFEPSPISPGEFDPAIAPITKRLLDLMNEAVAVNGRLVLFSSQTPEIELHVFLFALFLHQVMAFEAYAWHEGRATAKQHAEPVSPLLRRSIREHVLAEHGYALSDATEQMLRAFEGEDAAPREVRQPLDLYRLCVYSVTVAPITSVPNG